MVKKILLPLLLIISIIILAILSKYVYNNYTDRTDFKNEIMSISENNKEKIFTIDKIVYFSSCHADTSIGGNSNFIINDMYQYTDIAIFINNNAEEYDIENTLKNVSIRNIQFRVLPTIGTPNLYYKNINNFASPQYLEENLINDNLNFEISSEDEINLDSPILYNNCANPITISYVNKNLKNNYAISDTSNLVTYDGSLLKKSNIILNALQCSISFDIYITNNANEEFKCNLILDIPLENEQTSIYDGNLNVKDTTNYRFYRYK